MHQQTDTITLSIVCAKILKKQTSQQRVAQGVVRIGEAFYKDHTKLVSLLLYTRKF